MTCSDTRLRLYYVAATVRQSEPAFVLQSAVEEYRPGPAVGGGRQPLFSSKY